MKLYILFGCVCALLSGCAKTITMNNVFPYSEMMTKKYQMQRDCYVYKYRDNKKELVLKAVGFDVMPLSGFPRQNFINPDWVGKKNADIEIVGVLPKMSILSVSDVQRRITFEHDYINIYMEGTMNDKSCVFNALWLQKENEKNQTVLDENLVIPVNISTTK